MPKELVQGVNGQTAYEEENYRVMPILHVAEQAVANASRDLVNKHNSAFTNERILKQRQVLRMIPIGEVRFQWKSTNGIFYVYGFERKVYFVDYPQKCCCCSIL
ncbi:protein SSUH2 homolog [Stegodyphus dumicola]|uniref:protein SSUH2 homolog n=1 Tax=Stegodyphus dumicola TaxID=202533 RepID=UPI0015B3636D|nr:protein SSUH2 homolog [Stegodyphus dumicola]